MGAELVHCNYQGSLDEAYGSFRSDQDEAITAQWINVDLDAPEAIKDMQFQEACCYSGSFASKETEVNEVPGKWDEDDALSHLEANHNKWEPLFAYQLKGDRPRWLIGGWCAC